MLFTLLHYFHEMADMLHLWLCRLLRHGRLFTSAAFAFLCHAADGASFRFRLGRAALISFRRFFLLLFAAQIA